MKRDLRYTNAGIALPIVIAAAALLLTLAATLIGLFEDFTAIKRAEMVPERRRIALRLQASNGDLNCLEGEKLKRITLPLPQPPAHLPQTSRFDNPRALPIIVLHSASKKLLHCLVASSSWASGERNCADPVIAGSVTIEGNVYVTSPTTWADAEQLQVTIQGDLAGQELTLSAPRCEIEVLGDVQLVTLDATACGALVLSAPLGTIRIDSVLSPPSGFLNGGPQSKVSGVLPAEVSVLDYQHSATLGFRGCGPL